MHMKKNEVIALFTLPCDEPANLGTEGEGGGVLSEAYEACPKGEVVFFSIDVGELQGDRDNFGWDVGCSVGDTFEVAAMLVVVVGIELDYPAVGNIIWVATHLALEVVLLIHAAPELGVHLAVGSLLYLAEDGQKLVHPPVELVLTECLGALNDGVPILWRAFEDDLRDAADYIQLVYEIFLHGGHEGYLRGGAGNGSGGGEVAGECVDKAVAHILCYLLGKLGEVSFPWAVGVVQPDAVADNDKCFLALKVHEQMTQCLGVEVDMIGETLTYEQPYGIGREDKGTVVGIGLMHAVEEGMGQLHQGLRAAIARHELYILLVHVIHCFADNLVVADSWQRFVGGFQLLDVDGNALGGYSHRVGGVILLAASIVGTRHQQDGQQ